MNLRNVDVRSVSNNRPQLQKVSTSERPPPPAVAHIGHCTSLTSSASDAVTVIPWNKPTSRQQSLPGSPQSFDTIRPNNQGRSVGLNDDAYASNTPLVVRFDEEQIQKDELAAAEKEIKMDRTDLVSGPPTPVDDTPYIRFAIDQLTRDEDIAASQRPSTAASSESYPVARIVPDFGLGYLSTQRQREELALTRKHRSTPTPEGRLFNFNATRPLSEHSSPSPIPRRQNLSASPEIFIPIDPPKHTPRFPNLTYVPTILRPISIITLSIMLILMITALMFCAIYSTYHGGLYNWSGGVDGGRYFLFGFFPQILAACLLVYIQAIIATTTRIMPFTLMAMDDAYMRANSLFLGIFPKTMLRPQWQGPLIMKISNSLLWLTIFTIPLQSCLFSVIMHNGVWRWSTVQGVAWTLVALYILILAGTLISGMFFFRRMTGLLWDPRSLADIIALLPRSNSLGDYAETDIMASNQELQNRLALRSDRLGYWMTQHRNQGLFYCIGEEGTATRRYTLESGKISEKKSGSETVPNDVERDVDLYTTATRFRHIPWHLRDTFVVLWVVSALLTLLALFIIAFLPSTAIMNGFRPLLPAATNSSGWTAANFLYSFIPSLLGIILYILLQSIDTSVRKLQPWSDLGNLDGATAGTSLLVDYTARLPLECTVSAIGAGHYRVAFVSLMSFLTILLPVLAGGLFFALTSPAGDVRMFPNMPAFYICLVVLVLYVVVLATLVPKRSLMHLPHDVSCLAEIFSFVYASRMLEDAAFRAPRSKADLVTRLMVTQNGGRHSRYAFGLYRGRHGKECLGVDRLGRLGSARLSIISER
ncbi:hypothetical protein BJ875DRAFT_402940 [Amylocarpus encephaloides]|uniref:Phosphoribosylaminoimidazole-succinocarboxamide synthase n=1 Tax=Amylocarpus encephaloides TaxID=45428 RepID=A0A9P8C5Y1_9HELO|nr:hypothetical protein BJ875DRAFT_402940 [Amylocarpus encephaloides]